MKPAQHPLLGLTDVPPVVSSRPVSQRRLLTECGLWTVGSLAVSPRGYFQGWLHMGPSKDHIEESVCGGPTGGQMCTPRSEGSPQRLWTESRKQWGCKGKARCTGLAAAGPARGRGGRPVRSIHGATIISQWVHFELKLQPACPPQKPTSNKADVGAEPPTPPAQGCTASPRPRGRTGAGELGDDTSRKARPQLGVRGSRGATRGRLQTTPALRKDPVTAARAGVVLMRVVFPGESECLLSAYITTSSSESPLLTCLPVVCLDCPSFTVSGSRVSLFKSPDILICVLNLLCN